MTKPDTLKGNIKVRLQAADRHNLERPDGDSALWARSLTTQRVADLFRTLPGLPGHWMQLQMQVNAGNHHFCGGQTGHQTTEEGKVLIRWIADAVIKAAERLSSISTCSSCVLPPTWGGSSCIGWAGACWCCRVPERIGAGHSTLAQASRKVDEVLGPV